MSRAVFFKCRTCDDVPDEWEINRIDDWLRQIWAARMAFVALYRATTPHVIELVFGYHAHGDRLNWLVAHADHDVVIRDEYGREEPAAPESVPTRA